MAGILEQLEIDKTFFVQLGLFIVVFFLLSRLYFRPFMKLIHARHQRTTADQQAAEKMIAEADAKFQEYKDRIAQERELAKKELEALVEEARREEAKILSAAREEAKKITHEAAENATRQHDQLVQQLEKDTEALANSVSEKMLSRKG